MATSAVRTILLILLLITGLGSPVRTKPADRLLSEWVLVLLVAELSFVAIVRPGQPFAPLLAPILLLIGAYRLLLRVRYRPERRKIVPGIRGKHADAVQRSAADAGTRRTFDPETIRMALPLVENGSVRLDHLKEIGKSPLWLRRELHKFGYGDMETVNYLTIDSKGNFFMDMNRITRKRRPSEKRRKF